MPQRRCQQRCQREQRHGHLARRALDHHRPPGAATGSGLARMAMRAPSISQHPAWQQLIDQQRQVVFTQGVAKTQRHTDQPRRELPAPRTEHDLQHADGQRQSHPAQREALHFGHDIGRFDPQGDRQQQHAADQATSYPGRTPAAREHSTTPPPLAAPADRDGLPTHPIGHAPRRPAWPCAIRQYAWPLPAPAPWRRRPSPL